MIDNVDEVMKKIKHRNEYQSVLSFTKCSKDKVYRNQINMFCFLNHEYGDQAIEDLFQIVKNYAKIVDPTTEGVLRSK